MRQDPEKKSMKYIVLLIIFFTLSSRARAGLLLDVGGIYFGDALKTSSTSTSTQYMYYGAAMFSLNKDIWGGWSYLGLSQNTNDGTTATNYSTMDTGPCMKWQFGRGNMYSLSGTVNIISRASYSKSGSSNETWEGLSYLLGFGLMPEVSEGLHVGGSINYYLANYTKKTISGTESSASNSKSWIFPMLSLTKAW